jgi:hypothetical protein
MDYIIISWRSAMEQPLPQPLEDIFDDNPLGLPRKSLPRTRPKSPLMRACAETQNSIDIFVDFCKDSSVIGNPD